MSGEPDAPVLIDVEWIDGELGPRHYMRAEPEPNWLVRLAWPLDWTYCQIARPIEWLLRKLHVL